MKRATIMSFSPHTDRVAFRVDVFRYDARNRWKVIDC